MDWKTRKLLPIYRSLHRKTDIDNLYIPRKDGGRGLLGVKVLYMQRLRAFIVMSNSEEMALKAVAH